jgi:hypothetical protein
VYVWRYLEVMVLLLARLLRGFEPVDNFMTCSPLVIRHVWSIKDFTVELSLHQKLVSTPHPPTHPKKNV